MDESEAHSSGGSIPSIVQMDSNDDATVTGNDKQKRRSYTLSFKIDIVKQITEKFRGNLFAAAHATGIDRKQLRSWIKTAGKIKYHFQETLSQKNSGWWEASSLFRDRDGVVALVCRPKGKEDGG